jgi:hypothetical protein
MVNQIFHSIAVLSRVRLDESITRTRPSRTILAQNVERFSDLLGLTCRGNYASFWSRPVPVSPISGSTIASRVLIGHLSTRPAFSLVVRAMEASLQEPIRVAVRTVQKRCLGRETRSFDLLLTFSLSGGATGLDTQDIRPSSSGTKKSVSRRVRTIFKN